MLIKNEMDGQDKYKTLIRAHNECLERVQIKKKNHIKQNALCALILISTFLFE